MKQNKHQNKMKDTHIYLEGFDFVTHYNPTRGVLEIYQLGKRIGEVWPQDGSGLIKRNGSPKTAQR